MKTIKKNSEIRRVSDNAAQKMVKNDGWKYCPKYEFKNKKEK